MQVSSFAFVVLVAVALGVCRAADDPTVSLEGVHDLSEQLTSCFAMNTASQLLASS